MMRNGYITTTAINCQHPFRHVIDVLGHALNLLKASKIFNTHVSILRVL